MPGTGRSLEKVAREHINREVFDDSESYTNKEATSPKEHRYDTVNVNCLFAGG